MDQKTNLGPGTYDVCNKNFCTVLQQIKAAISSVVISVHLYLHLQIPVS